MVVFICYADAEFKELEKAKADGIFQAKEKRNKEKQVQLACPM